TEVAKVINKVDKILEHTSNLTISLDSWTAPNRLSIWNFVIMTPLRQDYAGKLWQQIGKSKESCEALITQLRVYKEQELEGLAKIYRFNLSNPIDQLHHSHTMEITSKIMMNIAETVFKEFEEILMDIDDTEMLNPTKDLYSNEQDLDLSISTFIDINSSVFTSSKN
ncbi:3242_t:CDS:2, partial [Cetraspora pellucida]